jgi:hypothetical protein
MTGGMGCHTKWRRGKPTGVKDAPGGVAKFLFHHRNPITHGATDPKED